MAVGKGKVRMFGGPAKKVNPIPREKDNTSDLERRELAVRNKRKFAAPDGLVPKSVTAPHGGESALPS